MKGILYTSYFAKIKKGKGLKISIARYNPKWLKDDDLFAWCKNLAPSSNLLNQYKYRGLGWEEYTKIYKQEMKLDRAKADICSIAIELNKGNDVTLYCYEKSTDNCHRYILGSVFKEMGYEVKEIE